MDQIDYWNGRAGEKWATLHHNLDRMLVRCTAELKERAGPIAGLRLLDIGCGTGETCTLWLAGGAEVTGVDISRPMLAVARSRTEGKARLLEADAATWRGEEPFDLAVSRFGVMFFERPEAGFANILANLRGGGRLVFCCWRRPEENPWATTPMAAVRDLVPEAPPPTPHAPGPFALADGERLAGILARAGFDQVAVQPMDFQVCMAGQGGARAAAEFVMQVGPAGAALAEARAETRARAAERLEAALAPHEREGQVLLGAAAWLVEGVRPG